MSDEGWVHRAGDLLTPVAEEGDAFRAELDQSAPAPGSPAAAELEQEPRLQHPGWHSGHPVARAQSDVGQRAVAVNDYLRSLVAVLQLAPHGAVAMAALTRSALETIGKALWLLGSQADLGDADGRVARWAKDTASSVHGQSNSQGRRMQGEPFAEGLAWAEDLYGALRHHGMRPANPPSHTESAILAIRGGQSGGGPDRTLAAVAYEHLSGLAHADRSALGDLFEVQEVSTARGLMVRQTLVFSPAATASCLLPVVTAHRAMLVRLGQLHGRNLPMAYSLAVSDLARHLTDED